MELVAHQAKTAIAQWQYSSTRISAKPHKHCRIYLAYNHNRVPLAQHASRSVLAYLAVIAWHASLILLIMRRCPAAVVRLSHGRLGADNDSQPTISAHQSRP